MKKLKIVKYTILAVCVAAFALYICSPRVADVLFTEYKDGTKKNNLWIIVNTKRSLFSGRESFLSFKRDQYSLSFDTKGQTYTETDMEITIYSTTEMTIKPRRGEVRILNIQPQGIVIKVHIDDDRIPKLINGTYSLRRAEMDTKHQWYRMKRK